MGRIWVVTEGATNVGPLAYFSSSAGAETYRRLLIERYRPWEEPQSDGRPIARDAGSWELGLGPAVYEKAVDDLLTNLPGAWSVKVDETLHMIACEFLQVQPGELIEWVPEKRARVAR